jgi:hypothetical protein
MCTSKTSHCLTSLNISGNYGAIWWTCEKHYKKEEQVVKVSKSPIVAGRQQVHKKEYSIHVHYDDAMVEGDKRTSAITSKSHSTTGFTVCTHIPFPATKPNFA